MVNTDRAWHWEATFPQPFGYVDNLANVEQLTVSVAQNLRASDGRVTNMSRLDARGRSFHDGDQAIDKDSVGRGANFQEQWDRALKLDPPVRARHRLERMDRGPVWRKGRADHVCRSIRRRIQPRHRADAGRPRRQLLLSARSQRPPL